MKTAKVVRVAGVVLVLFGILVVLGAIGSSDTDAVITIEQRAWLVAQALAGMGIVGVGCLAVKVAENMAPCP